MSAATGIVTSADGTRIGYEVLGHGPPALLVHGGVADRSQWGSIKDLLGDRFTIHLMDRRGRGLSADEASAYSLAAEAGDVLAVLGAIGEPTFVFGHAFGGLCALKAAILGAEIRKLLIDDAPAGLPGPDLTSPEIRDGLRAALDSGGPEAGLEFFLRHTVGLPDELIDGARHTPAWEIRKAMIHTLAREMDVAYGYVREADSLAALETPVRFLVGEDSTEPMHGAAAAVHADMPRSEFVVLKQRLFTTMLQDPPAAAQVIAEYFLGEGPFGYDGRTEPRGETED